MHQVFPRGGPGDLPLVCGVRRLPDSQEGRHGQEGGTGRDQTTRPGRDQTHGESRDVERPDLTWRRAMFAGGDLSNSSVNLQFKMKMAF